MRVRGKGLGDRLLLMPPSSTHSSPPPTLGSSSPGLPARVHLATKVTQQKGVGTLESDACCCCCFGHTLAHMCLSTQSCSSLKTNVQVAGRRESNSRRLRHIRPQHLWNLHSYLHCLAIGTRHNNGHEQLVEERHLWNLHGYTPQSRHQHQGCGCGCCGGCCCCCDDAMSVCMSTAPQSLIGRPTGALEHSQL